MMENLRAIQGAWNLATLALALSLLAGCSFDDSVIEGRTCLSNSDCPSGTVCGPNGHCSLAEEDGGLPDVETDLPDVEPGDPDSDPIDEPDQGQDPDMNDSGDLPVDLVDPVDPVDPVDRDSDDSAFQLLSGAITSGSGFQTSTNYNLQGTTGLPGMPGEQQMTSTNFRMQSGIAPQTALNQ